MNVVTCLTVAFDLLLAFIEAFEDNVPVELKTFFATGINLLVFVEPSEEKVVLNYFADLRPDTPLVPSTSPPTMQDSLELLEVFCQV